MACTTLLVGKNASYDGSTMIARNDDSGSGHFTAKKFVVVQPEEHPAVYRSVLSHVEVPLPEGAMRFTAMPNAVEGKGIWAAIRWRDCLLCGHPPRLICSTVSPPPRPRCGFRTGWSLNNSARYRRSTFI